MEHGERIFLRTLGHPVLRRRDGTVIRGLRRKDLALLAYLCVEGDRPFSRAHLAALLWGESAEDRARHSLTQALRRVRTGVGRGALAMERDTVRWTGAATCDAQLLLEADPRLDELLSIYEGPFLEGFEAGFGSDDFSAWADARRAELRRAAVRWLDRAGDAAERERDWERAQRIGERTVRIDPVWEGGHRRVMRALLERGERNLALRHYREFARWLSYEVGGHPDPETTALADQVRATAAWNAPPPAPPPSPALSAPPASPITPSEVNTEDDRQPSAAPADTSVTAGEMERTADGVPLDDVEITADGERGEAGAPPADAAQRSGDLAPRDEEMEMAVVSGGAAGFAPPARQDALGYFAGVWSPIRVTRERLLAVSLVAMAAASLAIWPRPLRHRTVAARVTVARAEVIRAKSDSRTFLAFGETLYAIPDAETLRRCTGGWTQRVRNVPALPRWPVRALPSVRRQPWLGGSTAVVAAEPGELTQYVSVGCVLSPIPDSATFHAIFGHTDWSRSARAPDSLLREMPWIEQAEAFPLRPAGTLIQGEGDSIRWVVFHGGALAVRSEAVLATYCRTVQDVVRVSEAEFRYYRTYAALHRPARPCRASPSEP